MVRDSCPDLRSWPRVHAGPKAGAGGPCYHCRDAAAPLRSSRRPRHVTMPMPRLLAAAALATLLLAVSARAADEPVTLIFVNADIEAVVKAVAGKMTGRQLRARPACQGRSSTSFRRDPCPRASSIRRCSRRCVAGLRSHRKRRRDQDRAGGGRQAAWRRRLTVGPVTNGRATGWSPRSTRSRTSRPPNSSTCCGRYHAEQQHRRGFLPGTRLVITDYADNLKTHRADHCFARRSSRGRADRGAAAQRVGARSRADPQPTSRRLRRRAGRRTRSAAACSRRRPTRAPTACSCAPTTLRGSPGRAPSSSNSTRPAARAATFSSST